MTERNTWALWIGEPEYGDEQFIGDGWFDGCREGRRNISLFSSRQAARDAIKLRNIKSTFKNVRPVKVIIRRLQ